MNTHSSTFILKGCYISKSDVAAQKSVSVPTVQKWISKGWLKATLIPGLGYLIDVEDLKTLQRPKPGRKAKA